MIPKNFTLSECVRMLPHDDDFKETPSTYVIFFLLAPKIGSTAWIQRNFKILIENNHIYIKSVAHLEQ